MVETLTNLAELRRLERDATAGPWCLQSDCEFTIRTHPCGGFYVVDARYLPDAPLIVAMRNALPALLDELERLRDEVIAKDDGVEYWLDRSCQHEQCENKAAAHLRDAIASMQPEGDHQPMQHVRAALAALEGRPQDERPEESA